MGLQQCTSMALWDVKQQQCIFASNQGKASPYTDSKLSALSLQSAGLHHALSHDQPAICTTRFLRWQLTMRLPKGVNDLHRLDFKGLAAVL